MVKVFPAGTRTRFVDLVCAGESLESAAHLVGATGRTATNWWRRSGALALDARRRGGGLADRAPADALAGGRFLTLSDRVTIQVGLRNDWSLARIAAEVGRDRSVVWREVRRNQSPDGVYYAARAHHHAHQVRRRPKVPILARNPELAWFVEDAMDEGWSPKLISRALSGWFPDDGSMQISHETIYRALYVQTRGTLRADLAKQLSTGRTKRVPHGSTRSSSPYTDAFRISERPAEVADRAVPGHWEGDLIIGAHGTAIGTLVERTSRFVLLLHLPGDHTADTVATSMIAAMKDLPVHLRRSITWDRGTELADYRRITAELNAPVFFCDPHSPWQRGSNENTNRLLRHWFEKGSDLSVHDPAELRRVQNALNHRPRPTLDMATPTQRLAELLAAA
ncbi:MAG: IS30 family transposase [Ramlibacter sp.]|nr:IS30 family transposase [Cryobacterium sp.]